MVAIVPIMGSGGSFGRIDGSLGDAVEYLVDMVAHWQDLVVSWECTEYDSVVV